MQTFGELRSSNSRVWGRNTPFVDQQFEFNGLNLMALFQHNLSKPVPERQSFLDFNEARDDGVAVASHHLHLTPNR